MRTPVEATGRRWNPAVFACFLGVAAAIAGMLGTGSLFLWIGVAAAAGVGAWLTSG